MHKNFIEDIDRQLERLFGTTFETSDCYQINRAVSRVALNTIWERWKKTQAYYDSGKVKQACYFSLEYLIGRTLGNNLINLGLKNEMAAMLEKNGIDFHHLEEAETDAALGNGGLGRLAACFLDSLATLNLPGTGYGLRYKYGMFAQKIENGYQVELPDVWLSDGDPWSVVRRNEAVTVEFGGQVVVDNLGNGREKFRTVNADKVIAVPYDMPIVGYNAKVVNTLRLWEAESPNGFNLQLFNEGQYLRSVEKQAAAEDITRVLYPNDNWPGGKVLRLKQQYLLSSASLQDILRRYKACYGNDFTRLPEKYTIQLNDTHPVISIPELMRLLMDQESLTWGEAWTITRKVFAYTNHTILAEALESWPIETFQNLFPRIYQIVDEINRRFLLDLRSAHPQDFARHHRMSIIGDGVVKMAWLAIAAGYSVNGVAALHTEILKKTALKDWFELYPDKFNNKTNGVTQRRWLLKSNPRLSGLITTKIGDGWITDFSQMAQLKKLADDEAFLKELMDIKRENKVRLAEYIHQTCNVTVDPDSIFDVQVKRLHEYKRQLLNIFHIISLYFQIKKNPALDLYPRTFIFAAKAAPGYRRAKLIIKLINDIAETVNNDPDVAGKLRVVFIPNYCVSAAEKIIPAADVSEQISTAGKEASGTGNMKFMINGAITIGTMDGANIEIVEEAGTDNEVIFGMLADEVEALKNSGTYNPQQEAEKDPMLNRVLHSLIDGSFNTQDIYRELYNALIYGVDGSRPDRYFVLRDYASYAEAQARIDAAYRDKKRWRKMSLMNIATSGKFSSDRTIKEYAGEIWKIAPVQID
jgi:starch phosphorylase